MQYSYSDDTDFSPTFIHSKEERVLIYITFMLCCYETKASHSDHCTDTLIITIEFTSQMIMYRMHIYSQNRSCKEH